jgi:hypothetical protein
MPVDIDVRNKLIFSWGVSASAYLAATVGESASIAPAATVTINQLLGTAERGITLNIRSMALSLIDIS